MVLSTADEPGQFTADYLPRPIHCEGFTSPQNNNNTNDVPYLSFNIGMRTGIEPCAFNMLALCRARGKLFYFRIHNNLSKVQSPTKN
ncbi:hypothetical protein QTP88_014206 [Uroleucon formosanum]